MLGTFITRWGPWMQKLSNAKEKVVLGREAQQRWSVKWEQSANRRGFVGGRMGRNVPPRDTFLCSHWLLFTAGFLSTLS